MKELSRFTSLGLFAGLTEEQLAAVVRLARPGKLRSGEAILREGEFSRSLFLLAEGTVAVTRRLGFLPEEENASSGRNKTLVHLSAPQSFGEMGLLEDAERSASVIAEGDCEVLEITREDFQKLVESDAELGYRLVYNIALVTATRLRQTDREVLKLTAALSLALGNR